MKIRLKRADVDRLARVFLQSVENKEAYILKGIKASKEFKAFVQDYMSSFNPLLFDLNDESMYIETTSYKHTKSEFKKRYMIPQIAEYVGDDFEIDKELLDRWGNLK